LLSKKEGRKSSWGRQEDGVVQGKIDGVKGLWNLKEEVWGEGGKDRVLWLDWEALTKGNHFTRRGIIKGPRRRPGATMVWGDFRGRGIPPQKVRNRYKTAYHQEMPMERETVQERGFPQENSVKKGPGSLACVCNRSSKRQG